MNGSEQSSSLAIMRRNSGGGLINSAIVSSNDQSQVWTEFCDQYARRVAVEFAQNWHNYLTDTNNYQDAIPTDVDASLRFNDTFATQFDVEMHRLYANLRLLRNHTPMTVSTMTAATNLTDDSDGEDAPPPSEPIMIVSTIDHHQRFGRRFPSLREIKHSLFSTRSCDTAVDSRRLRNKRTSWLKSKSFSTSKTVVQLIRDGVVNYVGGHELDGVRWEKCRMALVKTVGGFMLEFYCPPKVSSSLCIFL
jgi:hypothetical protein